MDTPKDYETTTEGNEFVLRVCAILAKQRIQPTDNNVLRYIEKLNKKDLYTLLEN